MEISKLVHLEHFCAQCNIEFSFIDSLNNHGIIQIVVLENEKYVSNDHLKSIERAINLHYELNINVEGIDVISNLLYQIEDLQQKLTVAQNRLRLFESEY